MVNSLAEERYTVILGLIQSDDFVDSKVLENVDVAGSSVTIAVHGVTLVNGTHEG